MLATPLASDEANSGIYAKPVTAATAAGEECHIESLGHQKFFVFMDFQRA